MKASMYLPGEDQPVAVFDEISVVEMNDNHRLSPIRVNYKSRELNSSKVMLERHRDSKMRLELEDGRKADVLLQHSSLDMDGNAVGVLRVLGDIEAPA
jgi:hypothetical protein